MAADDTSGGNGRPLKDGDLPITRSISKNPIDDLFEPGLTVYGPTVKRKVAEAKVAYDGGNPSASISILIDAANSGSIPAHARSCLRGIAENLEKMAASNEPKDDYAEKTVVDHPTQGDVQPAGADPEGVHVARMPGGLEVSVESEADVPDKAEEVVRGEATRVFDATKFSYQGWLGNLPERIMSESPELGRLTLDQHIQHALNILHFYGDPLSTAEEPTYFHPFIPDGEKVRVSDTTVVESLVGYLGTVDEMVSTINSTWGHDLVLLESVLQILDDEGVRYDRAEVGHRRQRKDGENLEYSATFTTAEVLGIVAESVLSEDDVAYFKLAQGVRADDKGITGRDLKTFVEDRGERIIYDEGDDALLLVDSHGEILQLEDSYVDSLLGEMRGDEPFNYELFHADQESFFGLHKLALIHTSSLLPISHAESDRRNPFRLRPIERNEDDTGYEFSQTEVPQDGSQVHRYLASVVAGAMSLTEKISRAAGEEGIVQLPYVLEKLSQMRIVADSEQGQDFYRRGERPGTLEKVDTDTLTLDLVSGGFLKADNDHLQAYLALALQMNARTGEGRRDYTAKELFEIVANMGFAVTQRTEDGKYETVRFDNPDELRKVQDNTAALINAIESPQNQTPEPYVLRDGNHLGSIASAIGILYGVMRFKDSKVRESFLAEGISYNSETGRFIVGEKELTQSELYSAVFKDVMSEDEDWMRDVTVAVNELLSNEKLRLSTPEGLESELRGLRIEYDSASETFTFDGEYMPTGGATEGVAVRTETNRSAPAIGYKGPLHSPELSSDALARYLTELIGIADFIRDDKHLKSVHDAGLVVDASAVAYALATRPGVTFNPDLGVYQDGTTPLTNQRFRKARKNVRKGLRFGLATDIRRKYGDELTANFFEKLSGEVAKQSSLAHMIVPGAGDMEGLLQAAGFIYEPGTGNFKEDVKNGKLIPGSRRGEVLERIAVEYLRRDLGPKIDQLSSSAENLNEAKQLYTQVLDLFGRIHGFSVHLTKPEYAALAADNLVKIGGQKKLVEAISHLTMLEEDAKARYEGKSKHVVDAYVAGGVENIATKLHLWHEIEKAHLKGKKEGIDESGTKYGLPIGIAIGGIGFGGLTAALFALGTPSIPVEDNTSFPITKEPIVEIGDSYGTTESDPEGAVPVPQKNEKFVPSGPVTPVNPWDKVKGLRGAGLAKYLGIESGHEIVGSNQAVSVHVHNYLDSQLKAKGIDTNSPGYHTALGEMTTSVLKSTGLHEYRNLKTEGATLEFAQ